MEYKVKVDLVSKKFLFNTMIGWRKLFEQSQDILREIRKQELIPEDLYLKAIRLCELESLPKRYLKGVNDE